MGSVRWIARLGAQVQRAGDGLLTPRLALSGPAMNGVSAGVLLMVVVIAAVDAETTPAVRFSTLYVLPVLVGQAWGRRWTGVATAVAGATADATVSLSFLGVHGAALALSLSLLRLLVFLACAYLVHVLQRDRGRLERLALLDHSTELLNRHGFFELARQEIARSARRGAGVSLLYLDVDDFKRINDRYGHPAGDAVLADVAAVLKKSVRGSDLVARVGGDEFAVLLPETDTTGAAAVEANIVRHFADLRPPAPLPADQPLTVSVGRAARDSATTLDELLRVADEEMYRAKQARAGGSPTRRTPGSGAHGTEAVS